MHFLILAFLTKVVSSSNIKCKWGSAAFWNRFTIKYSFSAMCEMEYVAEQKKVQHSCLSQSAQSGVSVRSQRETFIILEAVFSNWHNWEVLRSSNKSLPDHKRIYFADPDPICSAHKDQRTRACTHVYYSELVNKWSKISQYLPSKIHSGKSKL